MIRGTSLPYKEAIEHQEDIFYKIMGQMPEVGPKRYLSPFRPDDKKPGCRVKYHNGILYLIDNATYRGKLAFNMKELLDICQPNFKPKSRRRRKLIKENELEIDIRFTSKPFKGGMLKEFHLSDDILNNDPETFLVRDYWCTTKEDPLLVKNRFHNPHLTPCIAYKFGKHTKLYFLHQKSLRWYSNCVDEVFNRCYVDSYDKSHILVTKSKKDALVQKFVLGYQSIGKQQEFGPLGMDISDYKYRYVIYDSDPTGLEQGAKLAEELDAEQIILPYNDTALFVKHDLTQAKEFFNDCIKTR